MAAEVWIGGGGVVGCFASSYAIFAACCWLNCAWLLVELRLDRRYELDVKCGWVAETETRFHRFNGHWKIAAEQSGCGENVVELGIFGSGGDGLLHAPRSLFDEAEVDFAGS